MAAGAIVGGGMIGGGLLSATGSIMGGVEANKQSQRQAHRLKEQGRIDAEEARREGRKVDAVAQVSTASPNTGSALDIRLSNAVESELEALRAKFGFDQRAKQARDAGKSALASGIIGGASSLIGTSALAASMAPGTTNTAGGLGAARPARYSLPYSELT